MSMQNLLGSHNLAVQSVQHYLFQFLLHVLVFVYRLDPYARVAFANQSQVTYTVTQSPCPTWDQTLLFTSVEICEDPENVKRNPPSVVVELYDHDNGLVRWNLRTEIISNFPTKDRKKEQKNNKITKDKKQNKTKEHKNNRQKKERKEKGKEKVITS